MNILLTIHHDLDRNSGASGVTWQLGQEYQRLGHKVQYYALDNLPDWVGGKLKGITFPWFTANKILAFPDHQPIDVVDSSTGDIWAWGNLLQHLRKKIPLLVTRSHGLEHAVHIEQLKDCEAGILHLSWKYPIYHGGFRLWEVEASMKSSDLVFFLNSADQKYAVNTLGVELSRTHVFPNGLPNAFLNLPMQPVSNEKHTAIKIAQIGTYIERKGVRYSARALNVVLNRYPNVSVSFLGTCCPEETIYADFDPAVRDRIKIIPQYEHTDLPLLLQGHHIKLLASLSEGFGVAIIEAMACGLAPVVTQTPGPMEIVTNGENGILIPSRDEGAIQQALEMLITNHFLLEELRHNAYLAAQRYSWSHIAQKQLTIYEEALNRKKCSRWGLSHK